MGALRRPYRQPGHPQGVPLQFFNNTAYTVAHNDHAPRASARRRNSAVDKTCNDMNYTGDDKCNVYKQRVGVARDASAARRGKALAPLVGLPSLDLASRWV